jgi:Fe2+ or Zn2+ uptake regulation protein
MRVSQEQSRAIRELVLEALPGRLSAGIDQREIHQRMLDSWGRIHLNTVGRHLGRLVDAGLAIREGICTRELTWRRAK